MKNLSLSEYQSLTTQATTLAEDGYGKKVLELEDHSIIKLFRVKRLISQASFYSPARRFAKNAALLKQLNIPTVSIIGLYRIKAIKRTAVHYSPLKGIMVRDYMLKLIQKQSNIDDFFAQLGMFIAQLHEKGIFFRSAHFGNIIVTPEGQLGLIDVSDMKISKKPLSAHKRLRNMKHIFRLEEDIQLIENTDIIEQSYLKYCKITSPVFQQQFLSLCKDLKLKKN